MSLVVLREPRLEDVEWITDACQDREIQRWTQVPRPYTRDHAVQFLSGSVGEHARWVIETGDGAHPVGVISIHGIEGAAASIGYWLAPRCRGRGFAVAAIELVREEIVQRVRRSEIRVDVVIAHVARDNAASRRAIEGAGFAEIETQHGPAVEDLAIVDTCVYACEVR